MKFIYRIMIIVGLLLLCAAAYHVYSTAQFKSEAIHAEGKITKLYYSRGDKSSADAWFPEVTFVDDTGKKNVFRSSVGSSSYRTSLGEEVDVIYRQGDADHARINGTVNLYLGAIGYIIFAVAFLFIGFIGSVLVNRGGRHKRLVKEGKPLTATIVDVKLNRTVEFNGRSPWKIVCEWHDPQSGRIVTFDSANIFYDPSPYLEDETITVYVAHNNLKKYYVDISHLPKKG